MELKEKGVAEINLCEPLMKCSDDDDDDKVVAEAIGEEAQEKKQFQ